MEGVHKGWVSNCVKTGEPEGLGDFHPQYGLGQIPGRRFGDEFPQKLKQNVKLEYNF